MTQHTGYYCPHCGIRYVANACKDKKLPCEHDFKDAFYTYRWDGSGYYKRFIVANERHGILFDLHNADETSLEDAIKQYLIWLHYQVEHDNILLMVQNKTPLLVFQEACDNAGGRGCQFPPKWRVDELCRLEKRREHYC